MRKLLIITLLVVALSGCSLKNNIQSNTVNNSIENKKVVDLSAQPNVDDKLVDTKAGVRIKFSSDYQVNTDGSIDFGPKVKELILGEGMTEEALKIAQSQAKQIFKYKFQSTNFRPADEILNGQGKLSISQGELIIINPWTVVRYGSVGAICDDTKLEVVGQKNNYIFSVNSPCSDLNTDQTSLNYLKEIISSMKLE